MRAGTKLGLQRDRIKGLVSSGLYSGKHPPRMIFHPFRAAHVAVKMSFTSAWSTRSSDTLALVAYSVAKSARSRCLGARSRMRVSASQA